MVSWVDSCRHVYLLLPFCSVPLTGLLQPQGHVQVLLNLLRGFTVQAALDAPRFCISAGSPETESKQSGRSGDINSEVYFEEGISDAVVETLRGTLTLLPVGKCARRADRSPQGWGTTLASPRVARGACLGVGRLSRN